MGFDTTKTDKDWANPSNWIYDLRKIFRSAGKLQAGFHQIYWAYVPFRNLISRLYNILVRFNVKKRWISKQSYLCQLFKAMGNCKQGSVKFVGLKLSSWTDGSIFVALENRKKLVLKYFGLIFPSGSLIWCFLIVNFLFSNPFRCLNSCLTRL